MAPEKFDDFPILEAVVAQLEQKEHSRPAIDRDVKPVGYGWAWLTLTALIAVFGNTSLLAQTAPPGAGQLRQQMTPTLPQPAPGQNQGVAEPTSPATVLQSDSNAALLLKAIRFSGNTLIDDATLRHAAPQIDQLQGQSVTLAQLHTVAQAVTDYYRQRGYFVSMAYVPHQTVIDGVVTIAILEGRLDQTHIGRDGGYTPERLRRYENRALCGEATDGCKGATLTRARADRAVGIVANLPGVASASGTLAPGAEVGTSDFTLDAIPGPSITGALGVDDYGNEYTGRMRETGNLRWNSPMGIGDLFTAALALSDRSGSDTAGRGALNAIVDYSLPVGYDGWRAGADYAHLMYRLGAPFDATNAYGNSEQFDAYVTYPIIVRPDNNLSVRASYGVKQLRDNVLGSTFRTTDYTATVGVVGDEFDALGGGGLTRYGLTLTPGRISYGVGPLPTGTPNAAGSFAKINVNVARDQTLAYRANNAQRLSLYAALQGQWGDTNLDSVEKFALGGPAGVRGYPVGEATGDEGAIATLEMRDSLAVPALGGDNLTLSVFRDDGWLMVNHKQWPGYMGPAHRNLGSTGVGADLLSQNRYDLKLMWAIRDAHGEIDKATRDYRGWLWLQAQIFF